LREVVTISAKLERGKQLLKRMKAERAKYGDVIQDFHDTLAQCDPNYLEIYDKMYNTVFADGALPAKYKELILTIETLMSPTVTVDALKFHMGKCKDKGITKEEMGEAVYTTLYTKGIGGIQTGIRCLRDVWKLTPMKLE
jgi:alkylhydroperoxidase/carboxymuconolactone decarboxylase family protein YurZ